MNVLVIEDNPQNMYMLRYLLESSDHGVIEAENGATGIKAAQKNRPDLILLDIQLPDMTGYSVAQSIRELPSLTEIPIIAVTSYAMEGDRILALEAGCNAYIEKPIDPETFIAEIEQVKNKNRRDIGVVL